MRAPRTGGVDGKADQGRYPDGLSVDPPRPEFNPRMVPFMRSRSGDDCPGEHWGHFQSGQISPGGLDEFRRVAPDPDRWWLDSNLPGFSAGSRTEPKTALTAACRGGELQKEEYMKSTLLYIALGLPAILTTAAGTSRPGR